MEKRVIYSDWLYIPKGLLYAPSVKASLTFRQKGYKEDVFINGWKETEDFLLVPREFYSQEKLEGKGFIFERRIPKFPTTILEDRIVLDKLRREGDRPIQAEAYAKMQIAGNGVLSLGCGLGKTVLALKQICEMKTPAIVVVGTEDLLFQWAEEIKNHIKTPFKPGIVQGPPEKWTWKRPITIAMIQTLAKYAEDTPQGMREHFGLCIWDECHHLPSAWFLRTAPLFFGVRRGISATPGREDGLENLYYAHIGAPFFRYIKQPLSPKVVFYAYDLDVEWNRRDVQKEISDINGELSFPKLWGFVGNQPLFQSKVLNLLRRMFDDGRKILVLSHRRNTLIKLQESLSKKLPGASGLVIRGVPAEERRKILKEKRIILGIMQLAKEGLDERSLDTLLILEPFKAEGVLQQTGGRILRPHPSKKPPLVGIMRLNYDVSYALTAKLRKHLKQWPTKVEVTTMTI